MASLLGELQNVGAEEHIKFTSFKAVLKAVLENELLSVTQEFD